MKSKETIKRPLAVVTGAGTGIGRAVARRLSSDFDIIAVGRRLEPLNAIVAELGRGASAYPLDVSKKHEVEVFANSLEESMCSVTSLVHAAGFTQSGSLSLDLGTLWRNWDEVVETNLSGPFRLTTALSQLLTDQTGRIIFLSSIAAKTGGSSGGASIYSSAKAGLHGLTVALAKDFAPRGITVNAIAPGFIEETEFSAAWPQSRIDSIVAATPMKRAGWARRDR